MRDIHNKMKVSKVIAPQNPGSGDTAIVGTIIDNKGFDSLEYVICTGSLSDSNATFTVLVEDGDASDLVADGAAVSDDNLLGTESAAGFTFDDDNETRKIGYRGAKRYTRLTITPSGNTGDVFICAMAIQMHAGVEPQA